MTCTARTGSVQTTSLTYPPTTFFSTDGPGGGYTVTDWTAPGAPGDGWGTGNVAPSGTTVGAVQTASEAPTQVLTYPPTTFFSTDGPGGGYTVTDWTAPGAPGDGWGTGNVAASESNPAVLGAAPTSKLPLVEDIYSCNVANQPTGNCGSYWVGGPAETPSTALAPAVAPAVVPGDAQKPARPGPGHMTLTMHALTLGALSATISAGEKLLAGHAISGEEWTKEFQGSAQQHAASITPIGGAMLSRAFAPQVEA